MTEQLAMDWEPEPYLDHKRDRSVPADVPIHAHTGWDCHFCATRNGLGALEAVIKAVKANRDEYWWAVAERWRVLKHAGHRFTSDDLVDAVGKPTGSANQVGARIRTWAMKGLIHPVGIQAATRPESHGRMLRVWEVEA